MTFDTVYARELAMYVRENDAVVIDIRPPKNYEKCHWPEAINLPFDFTDDYEPLLDKNRYVVFYCEHGGSSMQLARELGIKGYMVATVVGGYEGILKYQKKVVENN